MSALSPARSRLRGGRLAVRDRLRAMLPSAEVPAGDEPPGQRGLAMLLSVVVAVVMWVSFSMREAYTVTLRLPVSVTSTPDGQSLREAPPATATVTLQADGWTLLDILRNRPEIGVEAERATVDLGAALRESGDLPAGVDVQSIQPQSIDLALDTRTRRRLPIRLRSDVGTVPGFDQLRPPRLQPDSVTVTGSQALLGTLDAWPTDLIAEEDMDRPFNRTVALADTLGGLLQPDVRSVQVRFDIGNFTEGSRRLQIEVENLPPSVAGVRFSPSTVRATYRTPTEGPTYDRARTTDEFRAVVDWFDIARVSRDGQGGEVPVSARWPEGLDVRDVTLSPSRVEYFIQRPAPPPDEVGLDGE